MSVLSTFLPSLFSFGILFSFSLWSTTVLKMTSATLTPDPAVNHQSSSRCQRQSQLPPFGPLSFPHEKQPTRERQQQCHRSVAERRPSASKTRRALVGGFGPVFNAVAGVEVVVRPHSSPQKVYAVYGAPVQFNQSESLSK